MDLAVFHTDKDMELFLETYDTVIRVYDKKPGIVRGRLDFFIIFCFF